ncbi:MAG: hypothetical protein IPG86_10915 [Chitinophagaceae bacterium]|nr:hypothetical protein [Chitinophagaceae bacterium]
MEKRTAVSFMIAMAVCLTACRSPKDKASDMDWSAIPDVVSIDSLKSTDFVPTLDHSIDPSRNTVYAVAMQYAWDTLSRLLPGGLLESNRYSGDLNLLRQSAGFQSALTKTNTVSGLKWMVRPLLRKLFFNKTLPFPSSMEKADTPLVFNSQKVKAFGMYNPDPAIREFCQLGYYASDQAFLLKIFPKDDAHEIWLLLCQDSLPTLGAAVQKAKIWSRTGAEQTSGETHQWKYRFYANDVISLPETRFNIAAHYKGLEGQVLYLKDGQRTIVTAYQRTGFILNETGAVAESHAVMAVDSAIAPVRMEIPPPKKLIFNQPFYIILKRKEASHPYFVMRVANAELLVKN